MSSGLAEPKPHTSAPDAAPFGRRATAWLVALCTASLLAALLWAVLGTPPDEHQRWQATAESHSSIGYQGLLRLLRALGIPVLVSRHDSARRAGDGAVLLVVAPDVRREDGPRAALLEGMLRQGRRVLLVLPKWTGLPDAGDQRLRRRVRLPQERAQAVLRAAGLRGQVSDAPAWPQEEEEVVEEGEGGEQRRWAEGALPGPPTFVEAPQLVRDPALTPLLAHAEGTLWGERRRGARTLLVLSDPDLISNAGLHRGRNAELFLAALERLRREGEPVVVDETLHGAGSPPSFWRRFVRFPLVLVSIQGALFVTVLLLASVRRFGAPRRAPPTLEPGTRVLIENTAELLRSGGHTGHALRRYLRASVQEVARRSQLPTGLAPGEIEARLDGLAQARGLGERLPALQRAVGDVPARGRVRAREALAVADRIHRWREELLHGPPSRP